MRFESQLAGGIALYDVTAELPRHATKRYATRSIAAIERIYVHHSGALGAPGLAGAQASARYCVEGRGWPGAPYHFWLPAEPMRDDEGRLCVLRMQPDETRCYHTGSSANTNGLGVCLQGNTTAAPLTTSHVECLEALLPWLRERYALTGEWLSMHSEAGRWGGKAKPGCPGDNAEAWLRSYRGERGKAWV